MIWVIGCKGMLGTELSQQLKIQNIPFVGTDREISILEPSALTDFFIQNSEISTIINCSAYTAVDKAESEPELAFALNKEGPANIARLCQKNEILFIHLSTDFVFDGTSSEPCLEDNAVNPQSVYGQSKLEGEQEILRLCSRFHIVRTAWLYGKYGNNFVYTMLKLLNSKDRLTVIDDQIGSPTNAEDLAFFLILLTQEERAKSGLWNFSGEGKTSWFGFAEEIFRLGKKYDLINSDCEITPCTTKEYPTPAKRPAYSLLSKKKVKTEFNIEIRDWKEALAVFFEKGIELS